MHVKNGIDIEHFLKIYNSTKSFSRLTNNTLRESQNQIAQTSNNNQNLREKEQKI